ncbi:hypothetical protein VOLCADRAFT_86984 [Volvox carteri f. nagariensis]|uniref:Uncharacterized protein n=1 Tax=Volvox carteri f. nagariensis TaxID=3068 RepID=D8TJV5_VOLCA|nr:uncharacterized protein VOLCADRAFT_86984 [Volvox carteri f. nagariensis]EFJ52137.1 hypothetical protein VOLCADRAFT_86984 [Volvox carteri f. nagariensis]|eukprot:XP_002946911.1 hypothetical protein VOLCADRAFT_86984 [Volvox carteri f. nagariensis]
MNIPAQAVDMEIADALPPQGAKGTSLGVQKASMKAVRGQRTKAQKSRKNKKIEKVGDPAAARADKAVVRIGAKTGTFVPPLETPSQRTGAQLWLRLLLPPPLPGLLGGGCWGISTSGASIDSTSWPPRIVLHRALQCRMRCHQPSCTGCTRSEKMLEVQTSELSP